MDVILAWLIKVINDGQGPRKPVRQFLIKQQGILHAVIGYLFWRAALCKLQNISVVNLGQTSAEADHPVLHIITARVYIYIPSSFGFQEYCLFLIKKRWKKKKKRISDTKHIYRQSWDSYIFLNWKDEKLWKGHHRLCFNSSGTCSQGLIYFAMYQSSSRDKGTFSKAYNFRNPTASCRN